MMADQETQHDPEAHEVGYGHAPARPFSRVWLLLQPERRDLLAVVVFAVAVAILSLATPIAVESLVNTVAFGVMMWPVIVIAGVLMACLGLAAAIRAMQVYVIECLQRRLFVRVVSDYAHRLPRLKLEAFDHRYGPELANRFFDIVKLQKTFAFLLLDGVALVVMVPIGMVVLAFYHPFLLGYDIILLLLICIAIFALGWGGVRTSLHESHTKYDVAAWLQELLRCLRAFKSADGQQFAREQAERLAAEFVTARQEHFRVVWRQTVYSLGLQVLASTALLGIGGYLVINRQLTLGQLVAAELIVALIVASVAKLGKYTEAYYDLMTGAEKLGLLTDLPLDRSGGEMLKANGRGMAVRVRNLDQVSHRTLPTPADWHITPNERVAVVGPPGSGKTTFFEVLGGLREPVRGVIELDGHDVRGISLESLRGQVALVEEPDIFIGTVVQNVRMGRTELSSDEVREALRTVGLLGDIQALPKGLDTMLTPDGGPLSASQSRRLVLARALVGRPRLLILDGVLDALDLRACPNLLPRLFDRNAPWTLIVATTDPDVLGLCDRIINLTPNVHAELVAHTANGTSR